MKSKKESELQTKKISKMDIHPSPKNYSSRDKQSTDISTQTDVDSNKGKGISVILDHKHAELFTAIERNF